MGEKWYQSKTKVAVALGAGGVILKTLADFFNGVIPVSEAVTLIWGSVTSGYLALGVRGWFKK